MVKIALTSKRITYEFTEPEMPVLVTQEQKMKFFIYGIKVWEYAFKLSKQNFALDRFDDTFGKHFLTLYFILFQFYLLLHSLTTDKSTKHHCMKIIVMEKQECQNQSLKSCSIHLRALMNSMRNMCLEITLLRLLHHPGPRSWKKTRQSVGCLIWFMWQFGDHNQVSMVVVDGLMHICAQWPLLLTWFNFNPSMDM